ncbi:MAG: porin family protein [Woeseia sp.]|nr:porin family protein [Woeseia sp.]
MNTKLMLTALGAIGIPAVSANAAEFYAGVGSGGYRLESGEFKDSAPTVKLFGGFQLNHNVAFEGAYQRLFQTEEIIGGGPVEIDGNVYELSTKLSYPFAQRLQGYGRLGWSYYEMKLKSTGFSGPISQNDYGDDFSWALGANYNFTQRLGLRGEYGQLLIDDGDAEFLSFDVTYSFGQ